MAMKLIDGNGSDKPQPGLRAEVNIIDTADKTVELTITATEDAAKLAALRVWVSDAQRQKGQLPPLNKKDRTARANEEKALIDSCVTGHLQAAEDRLANHQLRVTQLNHVLQKVQKELPVVQQAFDAACAKRDDLMALQQEVRGKIQRHLSAITTVGRSHAEWLQAAERMAMGERVFPQWTPSAHMPLLQPYQDVGVADLPHYEMGHNWTGDDVAQVNAINVRRRQQHQAEVAEAQSAHDLNLTVVQYRFLRSHDHDNDAA